MKRIAGYGIGAILSITISMILSSPIPSIESLPLSNFLDILALLLLVFGTYCFIKVSKILRERWRLAEDGRSEL